MSAAVASEERVAGNGVALNVACAGPADGPVVVLLHGFPETWFAWKRQIPALAAAGYRVLAPDLRGYGRSDKPKGWANFRIDTLAGDVVALLDGVAVEAAAIVGHDWGGALAWTLAARQPRRVRALVAMNLPHPRVFRRHLLTDPRQLVRSAYIGLFQLPWLPEWILTRRGGEATVRALLASSRPGALDAETLDVYRRAWTAPGAMTAMLSWYRAAARSPFAPRATGRVEPPTLVLWGAQDRFLRTVMANESLAWCADGRVQILPQATHWLHHEEPERVNDAILGFLRAAGVTP